MPVDIFVLVLLCQQISVHIILPYTIVAVLTFICAVLCFLLPETKDSPTLENMDSVNSTSAEEPTDEKLPFEPCKEKEDMGELLLSQSYPA